MKVFVAKLSSDTRPENLRDAFAPYGKVISANIVTSVVSNRSRGFGFVEMENEEEALAAIRELNNSKLLGNAIVVKKAEFRTAPPSTPPTLDKRDV